MSKKSTDGRISYGQYKLADLFLFLLIMCVCETVNILAIGKWFPDMTFSISVMLLVSLIVLVRWNLFGALFPVIDGVLYCWLNGATAPQFGVYILGNAFVALTWLLFLAMPKEKWVSKWYLTCAYATVGFVLLILGRSLMGLAFGEGFVSTLSSTAVSEAFNYVFAIVGLLVVRRFDSMLTDQKKYLLKVTEERDTIKRPTEDKWEGYTQLNEDELAELASMDEYDKALTFNKRSLAQLKKHSGEELEEGEDEGTDVPEE